MTRLSVNINKIATLRNARGGNVPDVIQVAIDCERFGAEGITVHPRPDERHIRYQDVLDLKEVVNTEFNIEGYPDKRYMELVLKVKPAQATLVPDGPDVLTSNAGWDTIRNKEFLKEIIQELKQNEIRTSIFVDPDEKMASAAADCGADRVELYTESYASQFHKNKEMAIADYVKTAKAALNVGLELNAGHDLDLKNLKYFATTIPKLKEVSIGHALISDALYLGLENAINMYKRQLM
ncbi:MAG: pyridoxine 5'-phosphate synthase [Cytophagales bacterium]